jgi:hypothetical protein
MTTLPPVSTNSILSRVIKPGQADLTPAVAEEFLKFAFDQQDISRMHELAEKNQEGSLTEADRIELESYLNVGMMIDLLHAKARLRLSQVRKREYARG